MGKPKKPKKPKKDKKGDMAIRFVDAGGNDANDGLDNIGLTWIAADDVTWTESTFTFADAGGHGLTFAAGDLLYISGGAGATVGLYEVASATANNVVIVETTTLENVKNGSDFAAGDLNAGADITSSSGALLTADAAMNAVAAGDTVYLRSDKTYSETLTIDTPGTTTSAIRFVGYTITLDDDGQATIAAADTRTNCLADSLGSVGGYYTFENLKFTDGTGDNVNISLNAMHWRNCEFTGSAVDGIHSSGNGMVCESCIFFDCGTGGCDAGTSCMFFGCTFEDCIADAIEITWGTVVNCVFINIGVRAIEFIGSNGFPCIVYGCTIDGVIKNTTVGIKFPSASWGPFAAINNIIYDCLTGIAGHNNGNHRFIGRNNLLNANTTDYGNAGYRTEPGEVTTAPQFTDEGSEDYTLGASSPAKEVGFDAYETEGSTQASDIGALQVGAGAGGGGLLMANKRGNKQ